jgi:hypothetical protein
MSNYKGGNPNPTAGNNPDEYENRECPYCGKKVVQLAYHLLDCEEKE